MNFAEGTWKGLEDGEAALFDRHLQGYKGHGIEIGCCDGYSSAIILNASELYLESVDPFIPDSMAENLIGNKERYLHNISQFGNRASLKEAYSWDYRKCWYENFDGRQIDFLFIDGDHRYDQVKTDFLDWSNVLRKGGLLAIHDARMGRSGSPNFHPGPSKVAREFIIDQQERWSIIDECFTLILAQKR